jgi:hypothetical protein
MLLLLSWFALTTLAVVVAGKKVVWTDAVSGLLLMLIIGIFQVICYWSKSSRSVK